MVSLKWQILNLQYEIFECRKITEIACLNNPELAGLFKISKLAI